MNEEARSFLTRNDLQDIIPTIEQRGVITLEDVADINYVTQEVADIVGRDILDVMIMIQQGFANHAEEYERQEAQRRHHAEMDGFDLAGEHQRMEDDREYAWDRGDRYKAMYLAEKAEKEAAEETIEELQAELAAKEAEIQQLIVTCCLAGSKR